MVFSCNNSLAHPNIWQRVRHYFKECLDGYETIHVQYEYIVKRKLLVYLYCKKFSLLICRCDDIVMSQDNVTKFHKTNKMFRIYKKK